MEIFEDNERNLKWLIYSSFEVKDNSDNDEQLSNTFSILDTWKSENITEFITHMSPRLTGEYIKRYLTQSFNTIENSHDRQVYFLVAIEDNEIVGIVTINSISTDIYVNFKLKGEKQHNLKLDHIIVNPTKQRKGIATRMTLSIANNQEIFAQKTSSCGLSVEVDPDNIASLKLAENCGFKAYNLLSILNYWLVRLYRTDHKPENKELPISTLKEIIDDMQN